MSYDDIIKLVDNIKKKYNIKKILLTGGEPTFNPKVYDYIREFTDRNIKVDMVTNGTLLNEKNIKKMDEAGLKRIRISIDEQQLLELSANYGGYPVLFRMALDKELTHIPFIQTGAAIIIRNENGQILLQERTDRDKWGLPGGCQDLGEDLRTTAVREAFEETGIKLDSNEIKLIDTLSGKSRKNSYPNGDIVYNNTSLYLADVSMKDASSLKGDSETKKLRFFDLEDVPEYLMDADLIKSYMKYIHE